MQKSSFEPIFDHFAIFGLCKACVKPKTRADDPMDTLSDQDLACILAEYDLGALCRCIRLGCGCINEKWFLQTTGGQYLLRRRHKDRREILQVAAQHTLMQHLHGAGFPAPALVRTRSSATYLELQGEVYEVHTYIDGDPCEAREATHQQAAARTLGQFHNAVGDFDHHGLHWPRERYGPVALRRIIDRLLRNWRGQVSPQLETLVGELEKNAWDLRTRFVAFGQLPELVIHGDYHAGNLILRQGLVVGVVDYDLAHWCSRAMEVAEAIIAFATQRSGGLHHIVYPGVLDLDAVHRFLAAYTESASLSKAEIHALPDLIRTIWLCASIDPPLEPLLSLDAAPRALPEILSLSGWAQGRAADIVHIGLAAQARRSDPH